MKILEKLGENVFERAMTKSWSKFPDESHAEMAAHYAAYLVQRGEQQKAVDILCKLRTDEMTRQVAVHVGNIADVDMVALLSRAAIATIHRAKSENRRFEAAM